MDAEHVKRSIYDGLGERAEPLIYHSGCVGGVGGGL